MRILLIILSLFVVAHSNAGLLFLKKPAEYQQMFEDLAQNSIANGNIMLLYVPGKKMVVTPEAKKLVAQLLNESPAVQEQILNSIANKLRAANANQFSNDLLSDRAKELKAAYMELGEAIYDQKANLRISSVELKNRLVPKLESLIKIYIKINKVLFPLTPLKDFVRKERKKEKENDKSRGFCC